MTTQFSRTLKPILAGALALSTAMPAFAQQDNGRRTIPQNTVVRVTLEDERSRSSRVGDKFMAKLSDQDYSGFPRDTRFEGSITQVSRPTSSKPGVLDMKVHRAIMPHGRMVASTGFLASLDEDDVTRVGRGRLKSRSRSRGGDKIDWKWAGYGAAGGAVLGEIFGGSFIRGAVLGGLGGAIYGYLNRDKGRRGDFRDVELTRGKEFGIRMHDPVVFNDNREYRYARYEDGRDRDRNEDRDEDERDRHEDDRDRYEGDRDADRDRDDVEERRTRRERDEDADRDRDEDVDRDRDEDRDRDDRDDERDNNRDPRDRDERDARYERGGPR